MSACQQNVVKNIWLFQYLKTIFIPSFTFISPSKLDPEGPAYAKMIKSKKFDPKKSQVLEVRRHSLLIFSNLPFKVMADQERGNFAVDTASVRQEREEGGHEGGRRI